jgi:hypothetical protein
MTASVRFADANADAAGGEAEHFAAGIITLVASRAYAPGAPLTFEVVLDPTSELRLAGKTVGSKRRPDGRFEVRVRLTNLRRSERDALATFLRG